MIVLLWLLASLPSVQLAPAMGVDGQLVMDADFVYWCVRYHVPSAGSEPASKQSDQGANGAAIDWSKVGASIQRVPRRGGRPTTLAAVPGDWAFILALDEGYVYWTGYRHGDMWRMPKEGGKPMRLDDGRRSLSGGVLDGKYVFSSVREGRGGIVRLPKAGGPSRRLTFSQGWTIVLGVADGHLYFLEGFDLGQGGRWRLQKLRVNGIVPELIAELRGEITPFAFAGTDFYFVNAGKLQDLSLSTGHLSALAPTLASHGDGAVVFDGQYVYWTQARWAKGPDGKNEWLGNVQRVPRTGGPATLLLATNACGLLIDGGDLLWVDCHRDAHLMRTHLPK